MSTKKEGSLSLKAKLTVDYFIEQYPIDSRYLSKIQNVESPYAYRALRTVTAIKCAIGDDELVYKLIEFVYWRKSHTIPGAAMELHISKSTAYRMISSLRKEIAQTLGIVE